MRHPLAVLCFAVAIATLAPQVSASAAPLGPQGAAAFDPEAGLKQALAAFHTGATDRGQALLRKTLAAAPEKVDTLVDLGVALADMGAYDHARSAFERALRLGPDDAAALNGLGYVLYRMEKHENAISYYVKALARKEDPQYRLNLGLAYLAQERWGQAEDQFRLAVSGRSSDYWAYNNLGYALQLQGRIAEAVSHYEAAIARCDKDLTAHGNLGALLVAAEAWQDALWVYRDALKRNDAFADAHLGIANAYTQLGRTDDALLELRVLSRLRNPTAPVFHLMAELYQHRKEHGAAYREAQAACQLAPREAVYMLTLGRAAAALGRRSEAIRVFERYLEVAAPSPERQRIETWLQQNRGKPSTSWPVAEGAAGDWRVPQMLQSTLKSVEPSRSTSSAEESPSSAGQDAG